MATTKVVYSIGFTVGIVLALLNWLSPWQLAVRVPQFYQIIAAFVFAAFLFVFFCCLIRKAKMRLGAFWLTFAIQAALAGPVILYDWQMLTQGAAARNATREMLRYLDDYNKRNGDPATAINRFRLELHRIDTHSTPPDFRRAFNGLLDAMDQGWWAYEAKNIPGLVRAENDQRAARTKLAEAAAKY